MPLEAEFRWSLRSRFSRPRKHSPSPVRIPAAAPVSRRTSRRSPRSASTASSAVTAVTAQNTRGVFAVAEVPEEVIAMQIDVVLEDIGADAVKTGMLSSASIVETVADRLEAWGVERLVVDPVMVAKGGHPALAAKRRRRRQGASPATGVGRHAEHPGGRGPAGIDDRFARSRAGRGAGNLRTRAALGRRQGRSPHRGRHRSGVRRRELHRARPPSASTPQHSRHRLHYSAAIAALARARPAAPGRDRGGQRSG